MDCTSEDFVANCESNPALYKECQAREKTNNLILREIRC